jgi:hypothetical protein
VFCPEQLEDYSKAPARRGFFFLVLFLIWYCFFSDAEDRPLPQPPLAQEGLAALGDLGRLVHVLVVLEMNARRGFDSSVN